MFLQFKFSIFFFLKDGLVLVGTQYDKFKTKSKKERDEFEDILKEMSHLFNGIIYTSVAKYPYENINRMNEFIISICMKDDISNQIYFDNKNVKPIIFQTKRSKK